MNNITIKLIFIIAIVFGIILAITIVTLDSVQAQTNATNQTRTTPTSQSKEASQSIRGAMSDTGQFLQNATEKIASSKSARTIVNETSDVLGNGTVATKKFFSPK
jgi:ABC-type phosphate transport system substrate-binding protein